MPMRLMWSFAETDRPEDLLVAGETGVWRLMRPGAKPDVPLPTIEVPAAVVPQLAAVLGVDARGRPYFPSAGSWEAIKAYDPFTGAVSDHFEAAAPLAGRWTLDQTPLMRHRPLWVLGEGHLERHDASGAVIATLAPPWRFGEQRIERWHPEAAWLDGRDRVWVAEPGRVLIFTEAGVPLASEELAWEELIGLDARGWVWLRSAGSVSAYRLDGGPDPASGLEPARPTSRPGTGFEPDLPVWPGRE